MARGKREPRRATGQEPLSYMGVKATTPPQVITANDDPTTEQNNFDLGTIWINYTDDNIWMLEDITSNVANWIRIDTDDLVVNGNTGSATSVDAEMDIVGEGVLTTTGAADVLTIGHTAASDGQLIIGATGNLPAWASLTSSGGTITITAGANTLNLDIAGGYLGAQDFDTDSGTATIAGNTITIAGGTNINTAGAGSTVTVNLDNAITISGLTMSGFTAGIMETDGAGVVSSTAGNDGQLIIGATGAAPAWANLASASGTILITNGANSINLESVDGLGLTYNMRQRGFQYPAGPPTPMTSTNGITFDTGTSRWVTCGREVSPNNLIYSSADGTTWTLEHQYTSTISASEPKAIHCDATAGFCVAVPATCAANFGVIAYAADPTGAWTEAAKFGNADADAVFIEVYSSGTQWVAVGAGVNPATYYSAADPSGSWTKMTTGLGTDTLADITYGNGTWVVVGANGYLASTTDITAGWTSRTSTFEDPGGGSDRDILAVTYSSALTLFVAVGAEGCIATSADGITWTNRSNPLSFIYDIQFVEWDSTNSFFFCGYRTGGASEPARGAISYNGIKWLDVGDKSCPLGTIPATCAVDDGGNIILGGSSNNFNSNF